MMNVKDFECRSYERAVELLGGKDRRTVCNNTVLYPSGVEQRVDVSLHWHVIVSHYEDGRVELNSCGYQTATTKDRINRCLPGGWILCQRNRKWHLWLPGSAPNHREVPFVDGMTVPETEAKSEATYE